MHLWTLCRKACAQSTVGRSSRRAVGPRYANRWDSGTDEPPTQEEEARLLLPEPGLPTGAWPLLVTGEVAGEARA